MGSRDGRRTGGAVFITLIAALVAIAPASVSAATATDAWRAKVGSAGANGLATIQAFTTGTGSIVLKLAKLKPATYVPVILYKGTCGSVGTVLIKFPSIKSTSTGTAARTGSLTATQVNAIKAATKGTAKIAIRVGSGTATKCGLFAALAVPAYVAATITVGVVPRGVAVTPSGVWIANFGDHTLSRIDPATNTGLSVVSLEGIIGNAGPQAITYGEGSIWITVLAWDDAGQNAIAGSVKRVDPISGQVLATVPTGRGGWDITTSPGAVWVINGYDGTVSRIDPATNQVVATVTLAFGLFGIAYGQGAIWVANEVAGTVSRIDPATNQVVATIPTVGLAEGMAFGAGSVWVTNIGISGQPDGLVSRIDPATNQVVATIPVGVNPRFLAVAGGYVWVAMSGETTVVQVNPATNAVQGRIQVGAKSWGIAATDHAVWAVQRIPAPDYGFVTRINY